MFLKTKREGTFCRTSLQPEKETQLRLSSFKRRFLVFVRVVNFFLSHPVFLNLFYYFFFVPVEIICAMFFYVLYLKDGEREIVPESRIFNVNDSYKTVKFAKFFVFWSASKSETPESIQKKISSGSVPFFSETEKATDQAGYYEASILLYAGK